MHSKEISISCFEVRSHMRHWIAKNDPLAVQSLIKLGEKEMTGNWRDSDWGLGFGKIPMDVNVALVPAALRAIEAFTATTVSTKSMEAAVLLMPSPTIMLGARTSLLTFFRRWPPRTRLLKSLEITY